MKRSLTFLPSFQTGFSLIELMAAFVIFALGFGILLQTLGASVQSTARSAEYTQAALWEQSKLDTEGVGEHLKEGTSSGEFDDKYRWELTITKYEPPADNKTTPSMLPIAPTIELYALDLNVIWGKSSSPINAHFRTLRASHPDNGLTGGMNPGFQPGGMPPITRHPRPRPSLNTQPNGGQE